MKSLFAVISILVSLSLFGQEDINTDRPDQSDGTYILPAKSFQIETGFTFNKEDLYNSSIVHTTMLRYGLANKIELRLVIEEAKEENKLLNESLYGFYPSSISAKLNLSKEKKLLPEITAVAYLELPFTASKKFKPDYFAPTFLLAFQNNFTEKVGLGYNIGISYDGFGTILKWLTTASLGIEFTKKINFFGEYFAEYEKGALPLHNIDFGVLYLIKHNIQLDVALGSSLFNNSNNEFLTTGFSYKFK